MIILYNKNYLSLKSLNQAGDDGAKTSPTPVTLYLVYFAVITFSVITLIIINTIPSISITLCGKSVTF